MGSGPNLIPVVPPSPTGGSGAASSPNGLREVVSPSLMPKTEYSGIKPMTSNLIWNLQIGRGDDRVSAIQADPDLNDGEKEWLKQSLNYLSPEQFRESREVMAGRTEKQRAGGVNKVGQVMSSSAGKYYFSPEGIPVPISEWERPPDDQKLASLWGTKEEALDDSGVTTFAKSLWNGFIGLLKTPASILNTGEGLDIYGGRARLNAVRKMQGKTGEAPMFTEPFLNISKNFVDQLSFETDPNSSASTLVDTKAFESMSNFFNSENWHPSTQNITGLTGQAIGTVLQFMLGGRALGIEGPAAWGSASVPKVIASYAPSVGLSSTIVLADAIDSAEKEGLDGREKYAVGLVNAVGQGILEMAIGGGVERKLLGSTVKAGVQKEISNAAVKAFKDAGGEITPQALRAAFGATMRESAKAYPKALAKVVAQAGGEAGEELTQQLWSNALMALNQKVHGREAKDIAGPEQLKEYFTSALGGFLGGLGAGAGTFKTTLDEARGASIYKAIAEGKALELRNGLDQMVRQGKLDPEQRKLADFRIDSYERYNTETKDIPLDNEQKQSVFNLTWNDQNVQQQIADLEADTEMTPAIKEAKIKVLKERSNSYIGEIAGIIKQAQPEQQKPEERTLAQEKAQEKQAEVIATKPIDQIRAVAAKVAFENGPETQEEFDLNMQYPKEISYETERIKKISEVQDDLSSGRIKANGNISAEVVAQERIDKINQDIDAQIAKLDVEAPVKSVPVEPTAQPGIKKEFVPSKREKRLRIVNKVLTEREGFVHHTDVDETESLAGKEMLRSMGGARSSIRENLKEGDVLDVQRILPEKGKGLFFPGQQQAQEKGYKYSLTVHPEGEKVQYTTNDKGEISISNNLGSIKYGKSNAQLINRLLDQGKEVKLVVTYAPKGSSDRVGKGYVEYRVISKEPSQKPEEFKAKKENVTEIKSKAIKNINASDPVTFEEAVMRWFIGGGRVQTEALRRNTGFGVKDPRTGKTKGKSEFKSLLWAYSNKGVQTDKLNEVDALQVERFGLDQQQAENQLFETLMQYPKKSQMLARVLEIQEKADESISGILPEDWQQQLEEQGGELVDDFLGKPFTISVGGQFIEVDPSKPDYGIDNLTPEIEKAIQQSFIEYGKTEKFIEEQSTRIADGSIEAFDSGTEFAQDAGAFNEEGLETFYASDREQMPADISERPSAPTLLSDQDTLKKINAAETLPDVDVIMEALDRDKRWTTELGNAIIRRRSEIMSQTQKGEAPIDGEDEIDYQSETTEPLASSDPELFAHIQERLGELFPGVKVFQDAASFQSFLDKSFPDKKLDLTKIGAAIGEAVFIDPKRARQSTALHEYAHFYWDMLSAADPLKKRLEKLFGSEEAAVTAIGNIGTNAAKVKLSGDIFARAMEAIRDFWAKIKNAIWPSSVTKEQAAKIMADRIWKNADNVQATESGQPGPIKYMDDTVNDTQRDVVMQLQSIANDFDYNEAAHTYTQKGTGVVFPSVTTIMQTLPEYAYSTKGKRTAATTGKKIHKLVEAIAKSLDPNEAAQKAGLNISGEALESLINQIDDVMAVLQSKGQVLSETVLANSDFGVAGMSDITIISKDGKVSIFDFKSSTNSANVPSYETASGRRVSKKQEHGTQLGMYARLVEADNQEANMPGIEIDELGVIPITYKADKDGMITSVKVEKIIPVKYEEVRGEANRVFNEFRRVQEKQAQQEIAGAEPMSDEAFGESLGFSVAELKQQMADLRNKPIAAPEKKRLIAEKQAEIYAAEDATSQYKRDMKELKELLPEGLNLKSKSKDELIHLHNYLVKYDNLRQNKYLARIQFEINDRMASGQMEVTGIDWANQRDISKIDIKQMAPSDVPENHPSVQAATKSYLSQKEGEYKTTVHMEETVDKLIMALLKEKQVTFKDKATARIAAAKNVEKVYGNLYLPEVQGEWRALKNPYNPEDVKTLSAVELEFLKHITDNMGKYQGRQSGSSRGWWQGYFPQVNKGFWENYYSNGLLFARAAHINKDLPAEALDIEIEFRDPITQVTSKVTYGQAIKRLNEYGKQGKLKSSIALFQLQKAKNAALNQAKKLGVTFRETEVQKFGLSATGEMISRFQREAQTAVSDQSLDAGEAYKQYMSDMIHIDHMQPIMTELNAVRAYYAQLKVNPNMEEYLKLWIEGDILGKHFIGQFGRKVDDIAKFMQAWTYMNVMAFNIKGGLGLNSVVGKFNQFRSTGGKEMAIGEKRYWRNPKRAQAILKHYSVVNVTAEESVQNSARNIFMRLANAPVAAAENWIQGAAFLGQLTEEENANFDNKGNLIDKAKRIPNVRLVQMKKKTRDVQGKYGFEDKRMYKHFAVYAAGMGFKGWMPDMLKERLGQEYTDLFGTVHKGSYRSLPYILRDLWMMMSDPKNAAKSTDVNVINNKKNIREALSFIVLLSLYAMSSDDKEERKRGNFAWAAFTQVAGMFNLSSWEFLASQPMPALGTIKNLIASVGSMFSFYERPGKYGDTGDWMFPGKVLQILPYKKVITTPLEVEEFLDED